MIPRRPVRAQVQLSIRSPAQPSIRSRVQPVTGPIALAVALLGIGTAACTATPTPAQIGGYPASTENTADYPSASTEVSAGYPEPGGTMTPGAYPAGGFVAGKLALLPLAVRGPATGPRPQATQAVAGTGAGLDGQVEPGSVPGGMCPGMIVRDGGRLALDGQPVVFFGVNAPYLMDQEFPEGLVGPLLANLAEREVNAVRVWFFHDEDPDRFERLLDLGRSMGLRFVVVLGDNVFKGVDWFFGEEDEAEYRPHLERTVARFGKRPEILMWEVMNEPNCGEGRHDDACLETIRNWVTMASRMIKQVDPCHVVSSGMIGDGNYPEEQRGYRLIHRKDAIDIISVHRRSSEESDSELSFADDEDMPIYYGEIYDRAYDDGCSPLNGGREPHSRAERIKDDLRRAVDAGVDGYLLWDYAAGRVAKTDGGSKDYCGPYGFERDDPLWGKLADSGDLPPPVPW